MATIRLLKGRIRSAKNIAQITKAMELVAASKMKKAQQQALAGKIYARKIYTMVIELAHHTDINSHPLLQKPEFPAGKRLIILISTNKGLCGGLNTNLFRTLLMTYADIKQHDFITFGKKGADMLVRLGCPLTADFSTTVPFIQTVPALTQLITDAYKGGTYDGVDLVYNEFFSALKQKPRKKTILPLTIESVDITDVKYPLEFITEPSIAEVFHELLPHYLENQIRDAILQAEASEHSARMAAMRNATDNALFFIGELTLLYNKARQEKITYEIADIVTARLAVD